jgi:hypothetical protein
VTAIHVAIIDSEAAASVLSGRKYVESRFTRRRRVPYGMVTEGDKIYFKVSGGSIIGHSYAARVSCFSDLTPAAIQKLRRRYNRAVLASPGYWHARRRCRYGVLIWLTRFVRRAARIRVPRQYGNAWVVLSKPTR